MRRVVLGALVGVCACSTSCNEIVGARAPELDDRVVPCTGLADCEEAARECEAEPECVEGSVRTRRWTRFLVTVDRRGPKGRGSAMAAFRRAGRIILRIPIVWGSSSRSRRRACRQRWTRTATARWTRAGKRACAATGWSRRSKARSATTETPSRRTAASPAISPGVVTGTCSRLRAKLAMMAARPTATTAHRCVSFRRSWRSVGGPTTHLCASFGRIGQVLGLEQRRAARCRG